MRALFGSAIVLVLVAVPLDAQICNGLGPFGSRFRAIGDASFSDGAQAFMAGAGLSTQAGFFGDIGAGAITYDDFDGSSTVLSVDAGWRLPLGAAGTAEMCPMVTGLLAFGPNDIEGSGADFSSRDYSVGASLGTLVSASPTLQIVPAAGLAFAYSWFEFDGGPLPLDESETYGLASLGIGFVVNRIFAIRPHVTIPFGYDDAEEVYGVGLALQFGAR